MRPEPAALARRFAVAALAFALGGCLPAGDPPAGRHLLKDRTLSGVFLSPSEREGVPSHVFASGPVSHPDLAVPFDGRALVDVYAFTDGASVVTADGLAGLAPVIEGMDIPGQDPTRHIIASDSLGRPLFIRWNRDREPIQDSFELWRLDPTSGVGVPLAYAKPIRRGSVDSGPGGRPPFLQSPGRTQVFTGYSGFGWLVGLDQYRFIPQVNETAFIGEDFYCAGLVTPDPNGILLGSDIVRIGPDAAPEVLFSSTGYLGLAPVVGEFSPQLLLTLYTEKGEMPIALLDTLTLESKSLPAERGSAEYVSASPDGRLLLLRTIASPRTETEPADYQFFIYEWAADRHVTITSAWTGKRIVGTGQWRPGTSELWFDLSPDGFAIWRPGAELVMGDATLVRYPAAVGEASVFTADGRHWFSQAGVPRPTVYLGAADAPLAPLLALNPEGTDTNRYWLLDDGRLLVEAWPTFETKRSDIYLVDPEARTSRVLGGAGAVVAAGRERALALLNWQVSRSSGELTLVDYASGAHTLIAPDVYAVAVDRGRSATVPPGTDALALGTRVAFLSRNRLVSRDDGLWVTELP